MQRSRHLTVPGGRPHDWSRWPRLPALAVKVINNTNWFGPVEVVNVTFVQRDESATHPAVVPASIQTTFELSSLTLLYPGGVT